MILGHAHFEKYQRFSGLARQMEAALPNEPDWICVVMFYSALHLLQAYFSTKRFPFSIDSHPLRNRALSLCPELNFMAGHYRKLHHRSEQIRYDAAFVLSQEGREEAKDNFARVVAILEPKVRKRLNVLPQS